MENPNSITQGIPRMYITDFLTRAGIEWTDTLTFTYKNTYGDFFDVVHYIIKHPLESDDSQAPKNFEAIILDGHVLYIYVLSMSNDGSYFETTAKYRGTWRSSGYRTRDFLYRSENKNSIELKVFCNEQTASASVSGIVAQCRYSDLGEIIGRMPEQNANFCGNATIFQLTHSKAAYILPLSYGYFERDGQKSPNQLTVDVEVLATADYMDFVTWRIQQLTK